MEQEIIIQVVPAVASTLSIILNSFLIYVAYSRKNSVIGLYRYMIIATSVSDLCFSIVTLIASPVSLRSSSMFFIMLLAFYYLST